MRTLLYWIYATACYLLASATIVYLWGFLLNVGAPKSIDVGGMQALDAVYVIPWNVALLLLFSVQHSVMARLRFKAWWTTVVPAPIERATYLLATSAALALLMWLWEPVTDQIWHFDNVVYQSFFIAMFVLGVVINVGSTYAIDHWELMGLRQVRDHAAQRQVEDPAFTTGWIYSLVRHPIVLGWFVVIWATPSMTLGHLVLAVTLTLYNLVAVYFEEKDLNASIGPAYAEYAAKVRAFLPLPRGDR